MIDPYSLAAKVSLKMVLWVTLALVLVLGWAEIRHLHSRAVAAETKAAELGATLAVQEANGRLALGIMARHAESERARGVQIDKLKEEVRHAKKPIPVQCRGVLDPVRRALDGLRAMQSDTPDTHPARPRLPDGAGATGRG